MELTPVPGSVALARRWAIRHAPDVGGAGVDPPLLDTLELLVSELVTNAVVHAGTPCTISLLRFGDRLRVEVADGSGDLPVHSDPPALAEGGRGVGLVAMLSDGCGSHHSPEGGKICWFELCIPPVSLGSVTRRTSDPRAPEMGQMAQ